MSNDNRKMINPLLNVSVTGGTIEDFTQNAVLLPAAAAPPVLQPPQPPILQPTTEPIFVPNPNNNLNVQSQSVTYSGYQQEPPPGPGTFYNPTGQQNYLVNQTEATSSSLTPIQNYTINQIQVISYPNTTQNQFSNFPTNQELNNTYQQYQFVEPETYQPEPIQDPQDNSNPQASLQSVFSSFSSYLKIGGNRPQENQQDIPIPSVVDSLISPIDSQISATPVQFYSPTSPFPSAPPPNVSTPPPLTNNTYRRGGLKRPTYAPIPGLTAGITNPPPQIPNNLPPNSHSPLTPFVGHPLQCTVSSDPSPTVQPSQAIINPTPTPPLPLIPQVQQIERIKENLEQSSPFLHPVTSEEIELVSISGPPPQLPVSSPPILTPASYYPVTTQNQVTHSTLLNPDMSTGDSSNSSATLNNNHRRDSVEHPILTHNEATFLYRPVYHHWFFKKVNDTKTIWTPFSMLDSLNLETAYLSPDLSPDKVVATDGGRYDVNILLRERVPVYWQGSKSEVRRCSWFHKGNTDGRYVPYEENVATKLEEEYKIAYESSTWNRKVDLANGESVVFHGPDVLVLFPQTQSPDSWGNTPNQPRPRVVKRGLDEFHIEEGEPAKVDHLLFMVHGIGKFCDLKFRGVEEAVDEFRNIALTLVQSHYRSSCEKEIANRIEVLPISWHEKLHSEDTGVDRKMKGITLESIPRLREFTNDTILDVLFYTSPVYCQTIISSVGNELNRIYDLFKQRNPTFNGGVSLGGHSLGSLILFDILCHQHPEKEKTELSNDQPEDELLPLKPAPDARKISRRISYMMAKIGTGQPHMNYPSLKFHPRHFFALGSPVGMFVTVRGLDTLGEQFSLPTCPEYFNIFHPYDPVAYRIESLVNPELASLKPVLIPHHKGRKRMHLELKETMARVGADLKQKLIDSMKSTWNSFYQFSIFKGSPNQSQEGPSLEEEVNKVLEEQLNKDGNTSDEDNIVEAEPTDLALGLLNGGRRIDYVLQEAPLEFFNEYIFALTSHVCYWESNDTILLIVKEIYNSKNISADSQIPQQTMKIERTTSSSTSSTYDESYITNYGMDPTMPMGHNTNIGPPPLAGFVRKS